MAPGTNSYGSTTPRPPPTALAIDSRSIAYSIAWRSFRLSLNGGFWELKKNWRLLPWNGDSMYVAWGICFAPGTSRPRTLVIRLVVPARISLVWVGRRCSLHVDLDGHRVERLARLLGVDLGQDDPGEALGVLDHPLEVPGDHVGVQVRAVVEFHVRLELKRQFVAGDVPRLRQQ